MRSPQTDGLEPSRLITWKSDAFKVIPSQQADNDLSYATLPGAETMDWCDLSLKEESSTN
jgi:hypothetical protein